MKISVFAPIKNEAQFIGYGIMSLLPYVDEIVYGDANSTDGTVELIRHIQEKYDKGRKIKLIPGFDFKDFREDYTKKFNELMGMCSGEYLFYCHPDMILVSPGILAHREKMGSTAYSVNMRSFAGDSMEYEITEGRTDRWKLIMKNSFGLFYHGFYGEPSEDMYFRDITGDSFAVHRDMSLYPFEVVDSGIHLWHFCECKPRVRRAEKMERVVRHGCGWTNESKIRDVSYHHPRVTLKSQESEFGKFCFEKREEELPFVFKKYEKEFAGVLNEGIRNNHRA